MMSHGRTATRSSSWILAVLTAVALLGGCQQAAPVATRTTELGTELKELKDLAAKRAARESQLAHLDIPQLAQELRADSVKQVEPFNSSAFREMVSRGQKAATQLKEQLRQPDRSSFLGLLALRSISPALYGELGSAYRISVLVDALKTSTYFNAWGLPHLYWEDAAKAVIAEGVAAVQPLTALLEDDRAAPMWGEEEFLEYQRYKYRVKDYALALILAIQGNREPIPVDPASRDALIASILGSSLGT
jgi:hypothetical protein